MARIQVTMKDDLLCQIDKEAEKQGITRSGFLVLTVTEYFSAREKAPVVSSLFVDLASAVNDRISGKITDEQFQSAMAAIKKGADNLKNQ